jgi:riboflavin synthase
MMLLFNYLLASTLLVQRSTTGFAPSIIPTTNHHNLKHKQSTTTSRNMFTGIIEEMGTVVDLVERDDMVLWDESVGKGTELTVKGDIVLDGAYLGCSIAVNGVCLTATEIKPEENTFKVGLAPETLRRTYLGSLTSGSKLNLERASEIGGRNSGHFVQGHVDGVGSIIDRWTDEDSLFFKVKVEKGDGEEDMMRYIVEKGFVAIDGTSLTVCNVDTSNKDEQWFTFMLVEYTQKKIIIPEKNVGDLLNIEVDVLGKYSESALANITPRVSDLETTVTGLVEGQKKVDLDLAALRAELKEELKVEMKEEMESMKASLLDEVKAMLEK